MHHQSLMLFYSKSLSNYFNLQHNTDYYWNRVLALYCGGFVCVFGALNHIHTICYYKHACLLFCVTAQPKTDPYQKDGRTPMICSCRLVFPTMLLKVCCPLLLVPSLLQTTHFNSIISRLLGSGVLGAEKTLKCAQLHVSKIGVGKHCYESSINRAYTI